MNQRVIQTVSELRNALTYFNWKTFSLDTETTDLRQDIAEITAISLYDGENNYYIECSKETIDYLRDYFNSIVNKKGHNIISHNITFDMRILSKYNISLENCFWVDTLVFAHLLDECSNDNRLKTLVTKFLGYSTISLQNISGKHDSSNEEFVNYTLNDSRFAFELAHYFKPLIMEQNLSKLYKEIEEPFLKVLVQMEINGILVDRKKIENTTKELIQLRKKLEIEMYKELNIPYQLQANLISGDVEVIASVNLNSSKELQDILFNKLGLEIQEVSKKTGAASTGKNTINKLKDKHKFVELLDKYRKVQKLLTSFYLPLPEFIQKGGRVRPNYRDTGTVTGRLSCNNPNIQQLPRNNEELGVNVRSCFIAPEGYSLIGCDYSGQELRVLAEVTQDKGLIDAFNSGKDFHQETANMFGVSRTHAKAINFGIAYRKGAYGFAKDWGVTEEEAQKYLDKYFNQFPMVKCKMEETDRFLRDNDYVVQMFGRRRRFVKSEDNGNRFHLRKSYREAFNFLIQSASADMIRLASISTYKLSKDNPEWGLRQIASIHDENIYEVKSEYAEVAKEGIIKCFRDVVNFAVPMVAEAHISDNMGGLK